MFIELKPNKEMTGEIDTTREADSRETEMQSVMNSSTEIEAVAKHIKHVQLDSISAEEEEPTEQESSDEDEGPKKPPKWLRDHSLGDALIDVWTTL